MMDVDEESKNKVLAKRYEQLLDMKFSELISMVEFVFALSIPQETEFVTVSQFLLEHRDIIQEKLQNFKILSGSEYGLGEPERKRMEAM